MNILSTAFPVPANLVGTLLAAQARLRNHIVGPNARRLPNEGNRAVFLHPTKGFRKIAKKRLGE